MSVLYTILKFSGLLCNFIFMIFASGIIAVGMTGLQLAAPNTLEHTYFIQQVVMGCMIFMVIIFGCYGLTLDIIGVNIVFCICVMLIFLVQQIQNQAIQQLNFFEGAIGKLQYAWDNIDENPKLMQYYENRYHCCGLEGATDYESEHVAYQADCYKEFLANQSSSKIAIEGCLPTLQYSFDITEERGRIYNQVICIFEIFHVLQIILLSFVLHHDRRGYIIIRPISPPIQSRSNHVSGYTRIVDVV